MEKKQENILFIVGSAIGILCFLCVYGFRVLDVTYDAWLMNADIDLRQHYLGWCHFRSSAWHIPIGLIDSLSFPTSVSVIWTDSIPLFAVVFKLFSAALPETFQYFGWFALLSFALQGGISTLLIKRLSRCNLLSILSAPLFILSFTILQRMFYHTALGAQWILLLALLIWIGKDTNKDRSCFKSCLIWFLMGALCVWIHSYFVPMVAAIMLFSMIEEVWKKKAVKKLIMTAVSYCLAVIFSLITIGAFYQNASASGEGIGSFGSNLNTFINPLGNATLLPELPLYYHFQYEGYGYLGAGVLLLVLITFVLLMSEVVRNKRKLTLVSVFEHKRMFLYVCLLITFLLLAVLPMVTFSDYKIVGIPYPGIIKRIMNVFRSNGRFIWTPVYMIMLGTILILTRCLKDRQIFLKSMIGIALILQLVDLSHVIKEKRAYFIPEQQYHSLWDKEAVNEVISDYDSFVFLYNENDIIMDTAYYAYEHHMKMNNYYYARSFDDKINTNIEKERENVLQGKGDKKSIYVLRMEEAEQYLDTQLYLYKLDDHVIGTYQMIRGLEAIEE